MTFSLPWEELYVVLAACNQLAFFPLSLFLHSPEVIDRRTRCGFKHFWSAACIRGVYGFYIASIYRKRSHWALVCEVSGENLKYSCLGHKGCLMMGEWGISSMCLQLDHTTVTAHITELEYLEYLNVKHFPFLIFTLCTVGSAIQLSEI